MIDTSLPAKVVHGGAFFEAIGTDFRSLERHEHVVVADVLDAWFDPSPRVLAALRAHLPFLLRTSPPSDAGGLVREIARTRGLPFDAIVAGAGSSDLMYHALVPLIAPGSRVLLLDPTYGEYAHVCRLARAHVVRHRLERRTAFQVDPGELLHAIRAARADVVLLANPNSPTGRHLSRRELLAVIDGAPGATTFVVDETYVEYAGAHESLERDIVSRENLFVLKSMSKAYALSGARVAYLAGPPPAVARLATLVPPWAVSLPAQVAASEALRDPAYYLPLYAQTHALRAACVERARTFARATVLDTGLPFYLIELEPDVSAAALVQRLRRHDIFVRNCASFSALFEDRWLRVSVRGPKENERLLDALESELNALSPGSS
jgi:histidinol-phosphate/aromatic aminotransferase/cobyric acid decarboxylase-like protein